MTSTGSADAHLLARTAVSVTDTTAVTDGSRSQARLSGAAAGTASVGTSGEDETTALQGAVGALNLGSASGGPVAADTQRPPSAGGHMVFASMISVLIWLPGRDKLEVLDVQGPLVGHVKKAVIKEFKQLEGYKADQVDLVLDEDTSSRALDPAQSLREAGIRAFTKLRVVVIHVPTGAGATGPWFPDRADNVDLGDPTIVRRKETCAKIYGDLASQQVRLLRAPPGSGKTALGRLLVAAAPHGRAVKVLNANAFIRMGEGATAEQLWTSQMDEPMAVALDPRTGPLRTYIIDEVQLLYALGPDSSFWRAVKEVSSTPPEECRVQLLLMGAHGLQVSKLVGTPIELRHPWSLNVLLLTEAEVSELFGCFNSTCNQHGYPAVSRSLQLAMERVCGRHVGLLRAALRTFTNTFKGVASLTLDQEAEFTAAQLVSLGRGSDLRALPRLNDVSSEERAVLVQVALAGDSGLQHDGAEVTVPRLLSSGVLDLESPNPGQPGVLRFSSPAMRAHTLFNMGIRPELALPASALSDVSGFVRAAVKRMRSSELAGSLSKAAKAAKGGAAALKTSLLERQYQMSFYSAAVAVLPQGVFMSPDFGLADEATMQRRGYIDFFINGSYRIGIELTRDGKALAEHTARFDAKSGIYAPMKLKSWIVVDFRQSKPHSTDGMADTVFVVFDADFRTATIMQERRKDEAIVLLP